MFIHELEYLSTYTQNISFISFVLFYIIQYLGDTLHSKMLPMNVKVCRDDPINNIHLTSFMVMNLRFTIATLLQDTIRTQNHQNKDCTMFFEQLYHFYLV